MGLLLAVRSHSVSDNRVVRAGSREATSILTSVGGEGRGSGGGMRPESQYL